MASLIAAKLPAQICAVISNDPAAKGLVTAADHGIATAVVDHRQYQQRADFDAALAQTIDVHRPDIVVLAGFMRVLTEDFVNRYRGRLINIHPSLLPSFTGLHTHRQAHASTAAQCISSPRNSIMVRSSSRPPCQCCPATMKMRSPRAC